MKIIDCPRDKSFIAAYNIYSFAKIRFVSLGKCFFAAWFRYQITLWSVADGVKLVPSFFRNAYSMGVVRFLAVERLTHMNTLVTVDRDVVDHPRALGDQRSDPIGVMTVGNDVQPIFQDTRTPARGGRRAHCCVAAGLLTGPMVLSACLGATRASPSPSGAAAA